MPAPHLVIGDGFALYRGPTSGDGPIHRHAAFQVVIADNGDDVAMVDASGMRHAAAALVVAPMAAHRILASDGLSSFFVEPHCVFADELRREYGSGVSAAPELRRLDARRMGELAGAPSRDLDGRLVEALKTLQDNVITIPDVAAAVGLSPQRLRALARAELGMPLTRWRVWSRLRRAAEAVQAGRPLAEAAALAGFADQAHFTRQMREMMGLTPAAVVPILRAHALRAE